MLNTNYIERKISRYDKIILLLQDIKLNSDYDKYREVIKLHNDLNTERECDLNHYPVEELKKYNFYFAGKIKQIQLLTDDIIEKINYDKKSLSRKLNSVQNKKKLTVYNR